MLKMARDVSNFQQKLYQRKLIALLSGTKFNYNENITIKKGQITRKLVPNRR